MDTRTKLTRAEKIALSAISNGQHGGHPAKAIRGLSTRGLIDRSNRLTADGRKAIEAVGPHRPKDPAPLDHHQV
jgi:hypothetical protein